MKLVLYRLAGLVLAVGMFVFAFVLASVLLAVAGVVGLLVWGWLWWRGRRGPPPGRGTVIEGEYTVEPPGSSKERLPPREPGDPQP